MENQRHAYLAGSNTLTKDEKASFSRVSATTESEGELASSLFSLALYLQKHHERRTVILIDLPISDSGPSVHAPHARQRRRPENPSYSAMVNVSKTRPQ